MHNPVKTYMNPMPQCGAVTPIVASGLVHDINGLHGSQKVS